MVTIRRRASITSCHTADLASTSGTLESVKLPLEGRVWYDYAGQTRPVIISSSTLPAHSGRVMDDGSTQLYTFAYDPFGHVTNSIDPVGRNMTSVYDSNHIDLLEVRQTRENNNELLFKATYNRQHRPLTATDAAGQTTTFAYNARGQVLTATDAKNETTTFTYDTSGYLLSVAGPLPGTNGVIHATYDAYGRVRNRHAIRAATRTLSITTIWTASPGSLIPTAPSVNLPMIAWIARHSRTARDGKRCMPTTICGK